MKDGQGRNWALESASGIRFFLFTAWSKWPGIFEIYLLTRNNVFEFDHFCYTEPLLRVTNAVLEPTFIDISKME